MKSFIESQFSYCPLVWMFCSRKSNRKINYIHERALRITYNDYNSTFTDLLKRDNSVSIHHRNIQHVAIEMYKVINDMSPLLMKNLFEIKQTANRSGKSFIRQPVKSVFKGVNSLRNFGPIVWDTMLPKGYKSISTLNEFKSSIKSWVPKKCPCRLCKTYVTNLGFSSIY